ncbi:hypothetical protein D3C78_1369620 [compost metagenome]
MLGISLNFAMVIAFLISLDALDINEWSTLMLFSSLIQLKDSLVIFSMVMGTLLSPKRLHTSEILSSHTMVLVGMP